MRSSPDKTLPHGLVNPNPDWQYTGLKVGGESFWLADGPDMHRVFTAADFNFLEQTLRLDPTKYQLIINEKGEIYILEPNFRGHKTRRTRATSMRTVGGVRGQVRAIFNINPQDSKHIHGILAVTQKNPSI